MRSVFGKKMESLQVTQLYMNQDEWASLVSALGLMVLIYLTAVKMNAENGSDAANRKLSVPGRSYYQCAA